MSLSKQDLIDLLDKAQVIIDTVLENIDSDNPEYDELVSYLSNSCGDIQDASNLISDME